MTRVVILTLAIAICATPASASRDPLISKEELRCQSTALDAYRWITGDRGDLRMQEHRHLIKWARELREGLASSKTPMPWALMKLRAIDRQLRELRQAMMRENQDMNRFLAILNRYCKQASVATTLRMFRHFNDGSIRSLRTVIEQNKRTLGVRQF